MIPRGSPRHRHLILFLSLLLLSIQQPCCCGKNLFGRSNNSNKKKESPSDDVATAGAGAAKSLLANISPSKRITDQVIGLTLMGIVGFATDPLVESIFNVTHLTTHSDKVLEHFKHTIVYGAADSLSNGAKVTGTLLLVNLIVKEWLGLSLPKFLSKVDLADAAPKIGYVTWICCTISTIKRTIFKKAVRGSTLARVGLCDRLVDFIITIGAAANVFNILDVDIGVGFRSVFAASGVSALVFSLATKGLVEQIVGGFVLQAWDAIEEGETIRLGDGTEGKVKMIGLVETIIVGGDDVDTRIPNSQLTKQRVSILSRVTTSRVKQLLRFKYSDLHRLTAVLDSIKDEIRTNCDENILIVDGSKPFRAVLTQYEPDHIQAEIIASFNLKPGSTEDVYQRQQVLLSIAHAMQKHKIEFAIPSIHYHTSGGDDDQQQELLKPPSSVPKQASSQQTS